MEKVATVICFETFLQISKGGVMAKLADKEVGALIGRPLRWTGGDGEIETFRSVMRLVRRQQRRVNAF